MAVWVASIASAVVVIHQINDPMRGTPADRDERALGVTNAMPADTPTAETEAEPDDTTDQPADDGVIDMPMDTIVGQVPSATARPFVVIGPGVVTSSPAPQP